MAPFKKVFGLSPNQSQAPKLMADSQGWCSLIQPLAGRTDTLQLHSNWAGSIKALESGNHRIQRVDIYLGDRVTDSCLGDKDHTSLMKQLNRLARFWLNKKDHIPDWRPPSAQTMGQWILTAGYKATIDQENNLRFTIKRRSCDGQVKVKLGQGILRFTLPLGQWRELSPSTESAMKVLAREANTRCRLTRVAWFSQGQTRSCEAQADLSGLPWPEDLWRDAVRMAILGLELTHRRLGLELPLLAMTQQKGLVDWLCKRARS